MHKHHIFPKHIDPKGVFADYQIKVTTEEHAEIHGLLFDEYWRMEDFWAWQGLSGQIGKDELLHQIQINKKPWHKGTKGLMKFSKETRLKLSESLKRYHRNGGQNTFKGRQHTEETKRRIGNTVSLQQMGSDNPNYGKFWITNGIESKMIKGIIPKGWKKGRILCLS